LTNTISGDSRVSSPLTLTTSGHERHWWPEKSEVCLLKLRKREGSKEIKEMGKWVCICSAQREVPYPLNVLFIYLLNSVNIN
jgi:hypothetical protein